MADPADLADNEMEQAESIRQRQREAEAARPKPMSEDCIDCDAPIPKGRQLATGGTDRCIHCQELHDIRTGGGRR